MKYLLIILALLPGCAHVDMAETNKKLDILIEAIQKPQVRVIGGLAPNGTRILVRVDKTGWLIPLPDDVRKEALKKESTTEPKP